MAKEQNGAGFEALHIDHITRRFGTHVALNGLTITVQRGEFIALLGPSGCGKSTALNCLAGLMPLSSGRIMLDDRRIDTLPPEDRGFGMVFQNYALFPHMTVRRNIGFGLLMRGVRKAEMQARVEQALALVQLTAHGDKLPGQLSGGQQQRVAIARAIAINPPLVLMDEPLSNLDAKLRLEMRHEIRRIHHEVRRATIYVTHDQDEALSLADRVVVMHDGVVQQIGTPQELYAEPANLQVARFMGYRNVLACDLGAALQGRSVRLMRGGVSLLGTLQGELKGTALDVAIRPEEISLGEGPNGVEGRVTEAEYCGRDYLIDVETPLGLMHARVGSAAAIGDTVRLVLPPERVLAFPVEGSGTSRPVSAAAE
jgi:putative spermidine/putrescine transport system ATP-binding protein